MPLKTREVRIAVVTACPLSMFAVPVTGPLNWFTTHVVTPPAASGSVEPKKNSHVPPEHDELSVHWIAVSFVHQVLHE